MGYPLGISVGISRLFYGISCRSLYAIPGRFSLWGSLQILLRDLGIAEGFVGSEVRVRLICSRELFCTSSTQSGPAHKGLA